MGRVRDFSASGALTGTEKFYADNGSADVYVTADQIHDFVPYSAEALAFFARVTVPTDEKQYYDDLISVLVAEGIWAKLDALYLFAAASEATALENLVQDAYNCTNNGAPFNAYVGVRGEGEFLGSGFVDTTFNPSTAVGPHYTLNSACFGFHCGTASQRSFGPAGFYDGTNNLDVTPRYGFDAAGDDKGFFAINTNDAGYESTTAEGVQTGYGVTSANRTSSTAVQFYKDGVSLSGPGSSTSTGVPTASIKVGSLGDGSTFPNHIVGALWVGGSLSAGEHLILADAVNTYIASAHFRLTPSGSVDGINAPSNRAINIRDYGAVGDGVTNDQQAFVAFARDRLDEIAELWVPPGTYLVNPSALGGGDLTGGNGGALAGLDKLAVWAYGAVFIGVNNQVQFGSGGLGTDGTASTALISTTTPGDLTVTLVSIGDASKFAVGDWIMISALDVQATGFPPNHYYYQFTQIGEIAGDVISIFHPCKYRYSSAFPWYNDGDVGSNGVNAAGPATIHLMSSSWKQKITIYGITYGLDDGLTELGTVIGRDATFIDCTWKYPAVPQLGHNASQVFDNCTMAFGVEVDKDIESVVFRNCDLSFSTVLHQSAAPDHLLIENCKLLNLTGTPKRATLINSYIENLTLGTRTHGTTESVLIENCHINNVNDFHGFNMQDTSLITDWTNGVLTIDKIDADYQVWTHAAPGARFFFTRSAAAKSAPPEFTILDITSDAGAGVGNAYFHTTLTGQPTHATEAQTRIAVVPCNQINVRGCTGQSPLLRSLNQSDDNTPPYSYFRALLTGDHYVNNNPLEVTAIGELVQIRVNVIRAYGGANTIYSAFLNKFSSTFTETVLFFEVNTAIAGERIIAPGGNTGAQVGDTLPTINSGDWICGEFSWTANYNADLSAVSYGAAPIIDFEVITDWRNAGHNCVVPSHGEAV